MKEMSIRSKQKNCSRFSKKKSFQIAKKANGLSNSKTSSQRLRFTLLSTVSWNGVSTAP